MSVELDNSQRAVVEADPTERLLVIAGAGRGKTEVIAGRVDELVQYRGLNPADELLVLTFSRAAVAAARRRLEQRGTGAVAISTFDSFASRLLLEAGEDPSSIGGFDRRIRAATDVLRSEDLTRIEFLQHVLLDEVQDLVGDRAELALALLEQVGADCGFTALGDPLQAIYDWQLEEARSRTTSQQFMSRLVDDLGARRTALEVDYRARGKEARWVVELGESIRSSDAPAAAPASVSEFVDILLDLGPLADATNLVDRSPATTAVLCRTNGQALTASKVLREAGVRHVLRRPLQDMGVAPWVAAALGGVDTPVVDRHEVIDLIASAAPELNPEEAWVSLKETEGRLYERDLLDLGALRTALRSRSVPLGLAAADEASVVVSTIHRAKGLEFDRVLYMPADTNRLPAVDSDAEMRVTYVALSRARDELYVCGPPKEAIRTSELRSGRWAVHVFRGQKRYPCGMEATSVDVDVLQPVAEDDGNGWGVQQRLLRADVVGAAVTAVREDDTPVEAPRYTLRLTDGDVLIGRTSEHFGRALASTFGRRRPEQSWPRRINGLAVASVETVAGDPDYTRRAGLAGSGLWLVPRLTGLAWPDWKSE
ncbi:UvrD-helicase domain-containing protein [Blastococcus sp. VKM Ac-2987]|uniref:UvrD-helicase domain-containing protein n=1 Tax=Blastococcus sp. VKM Ac-2987 TaxID=3004141 RepID=UPI0022AB65BA|nr:UvrD-helicase domain-containing protein [Blastococcus sp. VKM Ac-2987]MCZ2859992.1 AAA family ATPase [Blastococcus sp. VKM Ac-2987]